MDTSQTIMMNWIGKKIYGFCDGYFGRDSFEDKTIEAIGFDWIVARECNGGYVHLAHFSSSEEMFNCLIQWVNEDIEWQ